MSVQINFNGATLNQASDNKSCAIGVGSATTGTYGVAIGFNASAKNNCVVIGRSASASYKGDINIGHGSITFGTTAADGYNVNIGFEAASWSRNSVAIGRRARGRAFECISLGYKAGYGTTGQKNVNIGTYTMKNCNNVGSEYNVNVGAFAGVNIGNGGVSSFNTCIGKSAGESISTGDTNTCVGVGAGSVITTGGGNVCIGTGSNVTSNSLSECIAIGYNVTTGNADLMRIGSVGGTRRLCVNGIGGKQGQSATTFGNTINFYWTGSVYEAWVDGTNFGEIRNSVCDPRLKMNMQPLAENQIGVVKQLNPITFDWNAIGGLFTNSSTGHIGFNAHELQDVIPDAVFGQRNAVTPENTVQPQTINTLAIISVLTKALQEAITRIEALESSLSP